MLASRVEALAYRRSRFATALPVQYRYSPSHFWLSEIEPGLWRIGMTRFATRMLGHMVDHGFDPAPGAPVQPGQIIGWVEGFKAISDVFCAAVGAFAGSNPRLKEQISLVDKDPYGAGWLYGVRGAPDDQCVDVYQYRDILDRTIDRILEKQKHEETS